MRKREIAINPGNAASRDFGSSPQFVTALARGLELLRSFRSGDPPLGNRELSLRTGLPTSTVSRLTYTLSNLGYLNYLPRDAKYTLSVRALALGFTALGSLAVRDVARPYMQRLADETGVSVALGACDRLTMVYVEHCRGGNPLHVGIDVGAHLNMATSAMGRAYLAGLTAEEREQLLARLEPGRENWAETCRQINSSVQDYRTWGFVLSIGEWRTGVNAVGVPLVLGSGELTFALNCGGPASTLPREELIETIGPKLVAIATDVAQMMGLPPRKVS